MTPPRLQHCCDFLDGIYAQLGQLWQVQNPEIFYYVTGTVIHADTF